VFSRQVSHHLCYFDTLLTHQEVAKVVLFGGPSGHKDLWAVRTFAGALVRLGRVTRSATGAIGYHQARGHAETV
jgi:hypothetical protein